MPHVSVLLREVIAGLDLQPGDTCLDGTLGGGGHAEAMLEATAPNGRLLGTDLDAQAIERAGRQLERFGSRAVLVQASFREMIEVARANDFTKFDAILLDLGVSSFQLDEAERGFSFQKSGRIDMRMDAGAALSAEEIVNEWPQEKLADVIYRYGEEPASRRIARAIVAARPLHSTTDLADLIARVMWKPRRETRIHPATRTFQALRIAANDELGALEAALPQAVDLLQPGGRLAVITFHSLEDRIVKQFVQQESRDCICPPSIPICRCGHHATLKAVVRKPIQPSAAETSSNPRSRSAKLRIAERLPADQR